MTDHENNRVHALLAELVSDAPPPPPFPEEQLAVQAKRPERTRSRIGGPLTALATLVVVLILGGMSAVISLATSGRIEGNWRLVEYETDSGMASVTPEPDNQALIVTLHEGRFTAQDACMPISGSYSFNQESNTLETSDLLFDMSSGSCPGRFSTEEERAIALALRVPAIRAHIDRDRMVWTKEYQSFEGPVVETLIFERTD